MQWGDPRPRHIRDPKTRAQEDTLQVAQMYSPLLLIAFKMKHTAHTHGLSKKDFLLFDCNWFVIMLSFLKRYCFIRIIMKNTF